MKGAKITKACPVQSRNLAWSEMPIEGLRSLFWLRSHLPGVLRGGLSMSLSNASEYSQTDLQPVAPTVLMTDAEMYAQHRLTNHLCYFLKYFRSAQYQSRSINQTLYVSILTIFILYFIRQLVILKWYRYRLTVTLSVAGESFTNETVLLNYSLKRGKLVKPASFALM